MYIQRPEVREVEFETEIEDHQTMGDRQNAETVYHLAKEYRQKLQVKDRTEHTGHTQSQLELH